MMKTTKNLVPMLVAIFLFLSATATGQSLLSKEWQIETAVLAAPEEFRDEAKVYGYDDDGKFTTLRNGTNQFVCIADNPNDGKFEVVAYHAELDDFMERGRELKKEGKTFKERFDIREQEVKSGSLKMPDKATLFVLSGTVNYETNQIENRYIRFVVYLPYETGESTGLPTKPQPAGHPWLMDAGTHRAHIMITPPK